MQKLIETTKQVIKERDDLPFSVYHSIKEQHLLNVPITKPLLILVLAGNKQLEGTNDIRCPAASFVFLTNTPTITIRNRPSEEEYFALLIKFDYPNFNILKNKNRKSEKTFRER